MSIQEGYSNNKWAMPFDSLYMLDHKIDKLTPRMTKLSTQGSNQNRPFKHKIYQGKRKGKCRIIITIQVGNGIGADQVEVIGIEDQIIEVSICLEL